MRNYALGTLWAIAGIAIIIGLVLISSGQADDTPPFAPASYGQIYIGISLASFGALCVVAALAAAAVGTYVAGAADSLRVTIAPPQPLPVDDAIRDTARRQRYATTTKRGGLSWSNDPD